MSEDEARKELRERIRELDEGVAVEVLFNRSGTDFYADETPATITVSKRAVLSYEERLQLQVEVRRVLRDSYLRKLTILGDR